MSALLSEPDATPDRPDAVPGPLRVEFDGRTGEWFGIWIVNLLLTIVTFGIYSAWAKVRRKKYFHRHTRIAGRSFDYHATGGQILVGRLIVLAGLVAYALLASVPALAVVMPLLLVALIPFLVVRALRFNARMTSWANVRFGFDGGAWRAFLVLWLYPALAALTLFLLYPFATRAARRYVIGGHRLGAAPFAFDARIGPFYRALLAAFAWLAAVGAVAVAAAAPGLVAAAQGGGLDPAATMGLVAAFYAVLFVGFFPAGAIYGALIHNAIVNGTTLDGVHRLRSDVAPWRLVWIRLSNVVAAVLSLGLLLPWTHIRLARYLAAHTQVVPGGSVDDFVSGQQPGAGAVGDAFTDIEGVDVGLPL